ncbi:hypothetical protein VE03_10462 [Pseudogymnoascus sp. 23342-1-I1]|nr:hypothetical protein VE03_10462 [Pseudogymnoascus sp. 23342-1-I1]
MCGHQNSSDVLDHRNPSTAVDKSDAAGSSKVQESQTQAAGATKTLALKSREHQGPTPSPTKPERSKSENTVGSAKSTYVPDTYQGTAFLKSPRRKPRKSRKRDGSKKHPQKRSKATVSPPIMSPIAPAKRLVIPEKRPKPERPHQMSHVLPRRPTFSAPRLHLPIPLCRSLRNAHPGPIQLLPPPPPTHRSVLRNLRAHRMV